MTIHRHIPDGVRYATISEPVLNDQRISWFDKCVLCSLLLKTPNWKVMATATAKELGVNEKTIRRSLLALEEATYLEPIYTEVDGKRWRTDSLVMATPRTFEAQAKPTPRTNEAQTPGHLRPSATSKEDTQPDISVRTPGHFCPYPRTFEAQPPGQKCPATESRVTQSVFTQSVFTESELYKEDSAEGAEAYAKMVASKMNFGFKTTDQKKAKVGVRIVNGFVVSSLGTVLHRATPGDYAAFGQAQ